MTTPGVSPPLTNLLYVLQGYEFPLGISDYLTLQKALSAGLGVGSRDELIYLCQTLWGKSRLEQEQIHHALDSALPSRLTTDEIIKLAGEDGEAPFPEIEGRADSPTTGNSDSGAQGLSSVSPESSSAGGRGRQEQGARTASRLPAWAMRLNRREDRYAFPVSVSDLPDDIGACHGFDFEGRLPVSLRRIQRIWSYFRQMRRAEGPSVELDAEATIEEIHRLGVLQEPVMVPRRVNRSKLIVFKDESDEMAPFARVISPLIEAAVSSGLSEVRVLYYRGVLSPALYDDRALTEAADVAELRDRLRGASLLVVGDAGCIRKRAEDDASVLRTCRFLNDVREYWPNRAWLNPTPDERWQGTSAMAIRRQTPIAMYPYDRLGLSAAIERLRGKLALLSRE